jgi:membrane protease YdiL (CAAX protease family)
MSASSISHRIWSVVWSAILAFLILAFGQMVWVALLVTNLKTSPAIPWAVALMALVLWLMWQYLGGKWRPHRTSETRRRFLRANAVSGQAWAWAMLAGVLSTVALAGLWIVLFQLVKMPANLLVPDFSRLPMLTAVLVLVMASLVSPITEESGFRGYCQVILEGEFRGVVAVLISSVLFALAHLTQGFSWSKLLVYFLFGVMLGAMAYLTDSILPGIAVHIIIDLTFFSLIWPFDATRRLVWEGGADLWFWLHTLQAIIFTMLALIAFKRLARLCDRVGAVERLPLSG